jgi:hypothetical protein
MRQDNTSFDVQFQPFYATVEVAMSRNMGSVLLQLVRWLPLVLLSFIVVEPSLRGTVLGTIQDTGDAMADHADRLVRELNWRLMNGAM